MIDTLSIFASALGLAAVLPQIIRMTRTRCSGGQSATGWVLGAALNIILAIAHLGPLEAYVLGAGNVLAAVLHILAVWLVVKLPDVPAGFTRQRLHCERCQQEAPSTSATAAGPV